MNWPGEGRFSPHRVPVPRRQAITYKGRLGTARYRSDAFYNLPYPPYEPYDIAAVVERGTSIPSRFFLFYWGPGTMQRRQEGM